MLVSAILVWCIDLILHHIKWVIRNFSNGESGNWACLVGKTAIVTGGSSGIGYATSILLASRGCRVIIACRRDATNVRDKIASLTGNPNIITKHLDLTKLNSVRSFAEDINKTEPRIDILINNAGIPVSSKCTEDGLNTVMQVNYFGPFLLTCLLVDKLKASRSPRIVFLSSALIGIQTLNLANLNLTYFKRIHAVTTYPNSKFCATLAAQEFAKRLSKYGIIVNSADPGVARTPIFDETETRSAVKWLVKFSMGYLILFYSTDVFKAAQTVFHLAASDKLESGALYFRCKPFDKPKILNNEDFCQKIWSKTEELVQLNSDERL